MSNYPTPLGHRLAYDRDGTTGFVVDVASGVITALANTTLAKLNNESVADDYTLSSSPYNWWIGLLFPVQIDLAGFFLAGNSYLTTIQEMQVSPDTTNGQDGTWTQVRTNIAVAQALAPNYRTGVLPQAAAGIKAVRWRSQNGFSGLNPRLFVVHAYGKPSVTSQRLDFWHPTFDAPLTDYPSHLDWGDKPRSSSQTRQVRIKNRSATLTASGITVGVEALTDTTPPMAGDNGQYMLSYDGGPDTRKITIPTLGPGGVSPIINIRQDVLANATLGLWAQRLYANPTSWA